jgi:uncharacterized membrane protein
VRRTWLVRVALAHRRTLVAALCGAFLFAALALAGVPGRLVIAWDGFALSLMLLTAARAAGAAPGEMAANAEAQEAGEWLVFCVVVLGIVASVVAVFSEFSGLKDASPGVRDLRVALVAVTLALSWLVTHVVFALRYAHEYYEAAPTGLRGGLDFPGGESPDYWDFLYFAVVIGMTFQVSDVQITDRKLRRLALVHGILGFLFNTIIVALTVNLAAGLL